MLQLRDKKFRKALQILENTTSGTRVKFFNEHTADKFLLWWFFYYNEDFITDLADFHYNWIESIFSGKSVLIEAFRGSLKTSITIAIITFKIVHGFNKFIVRQSSDAGASTRNTIQIAVKLLNEKLVRDYGTILALKGSSREDLEKKSVGDFDTTNGVKIMAMSLGQNLRGATARTARPDLICLDDIDTTDSVRNPDVIDRNYNKIQGETIGAMSKDGENQIIFLGNTIGMDGVVPRIREDKKGHRDIHWQPLIVDGEIQRNFFTEELVEKIKKDEGQIAFDQNYMLIPFDNFEGGIVKEDMIRWYEYIDIDDFDELYMHCDTTHTGKTTSDFFAGGVLGLNTKDDNFYLIDFVLEKLDVETQAHKTIQLYQKYASKIKKLTYDEKANQGFGYWIKKLAKEEYGISLPIQELKYPHDKVTHFEPHAPHFIANRVYLPSKHKDSKELQYQLVAFPTKGIHDDGVDMLSGIFDNYTHKKKEVKIYKI